MAGALDQGAVWKLGGIVALVLGGAYVLSRAGQAVGEAAERVRDQLPDLPGRESRAEQAARLEREAAERQAGRSPEDLQRARGEIGAVGYALAMLWFWGDRETVREKEALWASWTPEQLAAVRDDPDTDARYRAFLEAFSAGQRVGWTG